MSSLLQKLWNNDTSQVPESALMMALIIGVLLYTATFVGVQLSLILSASANKLSAG